MKINPELLRNWCCVGSSPLLFMHHFICLLNMERFKSLWCTGPSLQSRLFHLFRPADPWNAYMHIHGNCSCKEIKRLGIRLLGIKNRTLIVLLALRTPAEKPTNQQQFFANTATPPRLQQQSKFRCPGRTSRDSHVLAHFLADTQIFKKQDKFIFIWINSTQLGTGSAAATTRTFVHIHKLQLTLLAPLWNQ